MSQYAHEHEVPPEEYSQWRHAQERARQRANAETMMSMLSGAGQAAHQADHDRMTQSKHGIFAASTGQQLAQANAERPATVGAEWGLGRPLERNGHLAQSIAPAPARVNLTRVNDHPGYQGGESPLARWARERQQ